MLSLVFLEDVDTFPILDWISGGHCQARKVLVVPLPKLV
jgi:hypothetical protein